MKPKESIPPQKPKSQPTNIQKKKRERRKKKKKNLKRTDEATTEKTPQNLGFRLPSQVLFLSALSSYVVWLAKKSWNEFGISRTKRFIFSFPETCSIFLDAICLKGTFSSE